MIDSNDPITLILDSPLLIFKDDGMGKSKWVEIKELYFVYSLYDSSLKASENQRSISDAFLGIKSKHEIEESTTYYKELNYLYEIHSYKKKNDYSKIDDLKECLEGAPEMIIHISVDDSKLKMNKLYYQIDSFKNSDEHELIQLDPLPQQLDEPLIELKKESNSFLNKSNLFFGCNILKGMNKKEFKKTWKKIISGLYYHLRFSCNGLKDQLYCRFNQLVTKCFKNILRAEAKLLGDTNIYNSFNSLIKIFIYDYNSQLLITSSPNEKELKSIIYKTIITEGIFPIYVELNTMDQNWITNVFRYFCIDAILPWSTKYHAGLTICNTYYSYTPNNNINQIFEEDRDFKHLYKYYRIKILDFFPLDEWIEEITNFFIVNLNSIINDIKNHFFQKENLTLSNFYNLRSYSNNDDLTNPFIPINRSYSSNHPKNSKDMYYIYRKEQEKKREIKKTIYSSIYNKLNCKKIQLASKLSGQFYINYNYELVKTKFFYQFCKDIAKTEIKNYNLFVRNCQSVVANFVHNLYENLKPYITVLTESCYNLSAYEQEMYKKFASLNQLKKSPCFFNSRLDYYGIYCDEYLKEYLENVLKKGKSKIKNHNDIENIKNKFEIEFLKNSKKTYKKNYFSEMQDKIDIKNEDTNQKNNIYENLKNNNDIIPTKINECLSFLITKTQENIIQTKKEILFLKQKKFVNQKKQLDYDDEYRKLIRKKVELEELLREFNYYYFNSIRLQNCQNENKNNISYIGFLIIKDPQNYLYIDPYNIEKNRINDNLIN